MTKHESKQKSDFLHPFNSIIIESIVNLLMMDIAISI